MPLLGLEQQHGLRRVVPKTDDGADSLTRMNDVLTDLEHATSNLYEFTYV